MRAFHFYIDDWLSSKHVRRMDAHEERGYLRLILHAASEPDCGIPTDEQELADISLLGEQWFQPTKDPAKRFRNQTSGEKILACFFEKNGRYFNTRLLKEFEYQKEVNRKRKEASEKGVAARQRNQVVDQMVNQAVEQNTTNDVWVSGCVPDSSSNSEEVKQEIAGWSELVEVAGTAQMSLDPSPASDLCQKRWRHLSLEDRMAAVNGIKARIECGQYDEAPFVPTLENYIRGKKWRESLRPRAGPRAVERKPSRGANLRAELEQLRGKEATGR